MLKTKAATQKGLQAGAAAPGAATPDLFHRLLGPLGRSGGEGPHQLPKPGAPGWGPPLGSRLALLRHPDTPLLSHARALLPKRSWGVRVLPEHGPSREEVVLSGCYTWLPQPRGPCAEIWSLL